MSSPQGRSSQQDVADDLADYRLPEKLVNRNIRSADCGIYRVDNAERISHGMVGIVAQKAFLMKIVAVKETSDDDSIYNGQGGLILGRRLNPTPPHHSRRPVGRVDRRFANIPVTCFHNVCTELNKFAVKENFRSASVRSIDGQVRTIGDFSCVGEDIVETPREPYMIRDGPTEAEQYGWKYNKDFVYGQPITSEASALTEEMRAFELVRGDFQFQEHQKIGIAIYRDFDISPASTGVSGIGAEELLAIFGPKHSVNIYTGEITRVCDDKECFEHSINTFGGCSGAVVFLLDIQPAGVGVRDTDHGKAIAIHVGGDKLDGVMVNFAFKIKLPDDMYVHRAG